MNKIVILSKGTQDQIVVISDMQNRYIIPTLINVYENENCYNQRWQCLFILSKLVLMMKFNYIYIKLQFTSVCISLFSFYVQFMLPMNASIMLTLPKLNIIKHRQGNAVHGNNVKFT